MKMKKIKKILIIILTLFICYVVTVKYLTYNKLFLMYSNCKYIINAINNNNEKLFGTGQPGTPLIQFSIPF